MPAFSKKEISLFKKLNTPTKVQGFLNQIPFNFENEKGYKRETLRSPLFTLRHNSAHCFEGALLGAYVLSQHGFKPYIIYLKSARKDFDHVIVPFKVRGYWGALSKTNHVVLRYREPIYKNIRELVMSYFHEYFLDNGEKTLRQYSALLNLNSFEKNWATLSGDLWGIDNALDKLKHYEIVPKHYMKKLRNADWIEIQAGKMVEYKK